MIETTTSRTAEVTSLSRASSAPGADGCEDGDDLIPLPDPSFLKQLSNISVVGRFFVGAIAPGEILVFGTGAYARRCGLKAITGDTRPFYRYFVDI